MDSTRFRLIVITGYEVLNSVQKTEWLRDKAAETGSIYTLRNSILTGVEMSAAI